jgi:hypothetical protein
MKALRTSLVILGTTVLLISGLAWVALEREAILPVFPPYLYLVRHPLVGLMPARGGIASYWPEMGATVRGYVHGVDWELRREWDVDNDGVFDCREDSCDHKNNRSWSACVFRRVDGRWVAQPEEVRDCGIPGERGPVTKAGSETAPP